MNPAQNAVSKVMINNVNTTAGNTTSGFIDTMGADYCTIHVALAAITTAGTATADGVQIKVLESVDTNVSNATAITGIPDVPPTTVGNLGKKNGGQGLYHLDMKAKKRIIFCRIIPGTSGVSNEPVTATVIGTTSRREQQPTSATAMVSTGTNDWAMIG